MQESPIISGIPLAGSVVLVTGATGFTGQYVVRRLVGTGAQIRAIIRQSSDISGLSDCDVDWMTGSLADPDFVTRAMKGVSYVIHLATSYRDSFVSAKDEFILHVNGVQNLAKAANKQRDFERFIHVSTIGVHGHIEDPPADENYRFAPGDAYQRTKMESEKWIHQFSREANLPITIVRPAAIFGPGDSRLMKLFKMATMSLVPLVGNGKCLYHLIHVEDLADFLLYSMMHPEAEGQVYICGNKEPISIHDIISIAGECIGTKNRFIRLPEMPVQLVAMLCETICLPLRIRPPLHPRRVAFFTNDRAFDTSKMTKQLGFKTSWQNEDGIRDTAQWYLDQGFIAAKGTRLS